MSANPCVHFYVIAAADGESVSELAREESRASDELFYGSGPDRQKVWDRAALALGTACRELAVEEHRFTLPHGDTCLGEINARVREASKVPFEPYGALSPAELHVFRDTLDAVVAEHGERKLIASLKESRRMPVTTARLLAMLRQVLATTGTERYLVIRIEDGVWDAPVGEPTEIELDGDSLPDRLTRIDRAVSDGRVTERERAALVRAVKRVPKSADQTAALLDLAEMLLELEAKLSSN